MSLNTYKQKFTEFINSREIDENIHQAVKLIPTCKKLFFIGNGGSNAICSHMLEDFAKILKFQTFAFTDPATITCFANDYGYENAMTEWLKIYFNPEEDLLIAISSSGNSPNINNAVDYVKNKKAKVITLSGFEKNNKLSNKGDINFWLDSKSYGIVECYHQTILHIILDQIHAGK